MKKIIISLILIILWFGTAFAEDIYFSQTGGGSGSGSCANAKALSTISWGSSVGQIGQDDTAHLCGTLTSTLAIGGSGASNHPITIKFEDGAKFSKAAWGTGSSSAIYASGKSYIIIDGGINGILENTDNGTAGTYSNQVASKMVDLTSCSNFEIKNLTIRNVYVRTPNSGDFSLGAGASMGIISQFGGSNFSIHDCTFTYAAYVIQLYYTGSVTNYSVYNNSISEGAGGFWSAGQSSNSTLTGFYFYNNDIDLGNSWSFNDLSDQWHGEHIHTHSSGASNTWIINSYIYNNSFHGKCPMKSGSTSATSSFGIRWAAHATNIQIYNNVFQTDVGYFPTDSTITISGEASGSTGFKIYNNTFTYGTGGQTVIYYGTNGADNEFKNNIVINAGDAHYLLETLTIKSQIDYNIYYNTDNWDSQSWSAWQSSGYDQHSSNGVLPSLDANYVPTASDTVAKDNGVALSSYFTTDKAGNTRVVPWDIGAYEYDSGTTPAAPTKVRIISIF